MGGLTEQWKKQASFRNEIKTGWDGVSLANLQATQSLITWTAKE